MSHGNIHKKGFVPKPPEGCDLSRDRVLLHCCCAPCSTAIIEWMVGEGLRPGIFFSNSNIVPFREYEIRRDELRRYAAAHGLETVDDEYDHAAWLAFVRQLERPSATEAVHTSVAEAVVRQDSSITISVVASATVAEPVEAPSQEILPPVAKPVVRQGSPTVEAPAAVSPLIRIAEMPERGPRCLECFKFRLLCAARYASAHGYRLLTTTLASSRWKDLTQVDVAGRWACGTVNDSVPDDAGKVLWWNQNWRRGGLQERRNALIKEWAMYNQTFCGCEFSERH